MKEKGLMSFFSISFPHTPELAVHFIFFLIEIASVVVKGLHVFHGID